MRLICPPLVFLTGGISHIAILMVAKSPEMRDRKLESLCYND